MRLIIEENYNKVSEWAAKYIKKRINEFHPGPDKYFTLGLPTGILFCETYHHFKVINDRIFKYTNCSFSNSVVDSYTIVYQCLMPAVVFSQVVLL